jgi:lipoate-protein ligase A
VRVVRTHDNRNSGILINAPKTRFNIAALASGRNDILVDGKKISGSAYKISNGVRLVPPPLPQESPPHACVSRVRCVLRVPSRVPIAHAFVSTSRERCTTGRC